MEQTGSIIIKKYVYGHRLGHCFSMVPKEQNLGIGLAGNQQSPGVSGQGKGPAPQIWTEGAAVEHFADREHYQQRSDDEVQGGAKRGGEE